jgi:hypothetical protein
MPVETGITSFSTSSSSLRTYLDITEWEEGYCARGTRGSSESPRAFDRKIITIIKAKSYFLEDALLVLLEELLLCHLTQISALAVVDVVVDLNQLHESFFLLGESLLLGELQEEDVLRLLYLVVLRLEGSELLLHLQLLVVQH